MHIPACPTVETELLAFQPALREALERYPWRRLPRMQGIFAWLMRERRVGALLALARLKRRFLDGRRQ